MCPKGSSCVHQRHQLCALKTTDVCIPSYWQLQSIKILVVKYVISCYVTLQMALEGHPMGKGSRGICCVLLAVCRTENPWEANMFFVPAMTYAFSENTGNSMLHGKRAMDYVRTTWPFFNRYL